MTSSETENLERPVIGILDFEKISTEQLERAALKAIFPKTRKISGRSESRYRSYLAGRAAAALLFEKSGLQTFIAPHPKWGFLQLLDSNGRTRADCQINISHSNSVAVACVAKTSVGVDIEAIGRDASRVMKKVSTPEELAQSGKSVNVGEKNLPTPLVLWTAKEAVSKALGLGIKFGMQHFFIQTSGKIPFEVRTSVKGFLPLSQPAIAYYVDDKILIAVCTERELLMSGLTCFRFLGGDLLHLSA